jgi:hypothetical protein
VKGNILLQNVYKHSKYSIVFPVFKIEFIINIKWHDLSFISPIILFYDRKRWFLHKPLATNFTTV